jgi:hypothetical protein
MELIRRTVVRRLCFICNAQVQVAAEKKNKNGYFQTKEENIMDRYQELLDLVATFKTDFDKFYLKQNKSAGVRLRKHMATLKHKAQEIRNEVQEVKAKLAEEETTTPPAAQ